MSDRHSIKFNAIEFEKNNHSHLLFFKSTNNYYKLAGNSVLIYAGNIAQRIGRRYNLQIDTDHYSPSPTGIISFRLTSELIQKLADIKIIKDTSKSDNDLIYFKLPHTISDDELRHFEDVINADRHTINQIVMPKSPVPTLYDYIKELNLIIYQNSSAMPPFARDTIGKSIFAISDTMLRRYLEYAHAEISEIEAIRLIKNGAKLIKYKMKNVEDLQILHRRTICRILEQIISIEKLTNKLLKQAKEKPHVQR